MSPNTISSDEHSAKDLQRFLAWVTPIAFGFAGVFGVICLTEGNSWICVLALATFIDACILLVARIWVRRGTIKRAVVLICISLLATDILSAATRANLIARTCDPATAGGGRSTAIPGWSGAELAVGFVLVDRRDSRCTE